MFVVLNQNVYEKFFKIHDFGRVCLKNRKYEIVSQEVLKNLNRAPEDVLKKINHILVKMPFKIFYSFDREIKQNILKNPHFWVKKSFEICFH